MLRTYEKIKKPSSKGFRTFMACCLLGGLAGALLFALEGAWILRSNAAGLQLELKGVVASLVSATRPLLGWLLFRIGELYALSGAACGACAFAAACALGVRRGWRFWLAWAAELLTMAVLGVWPFVLERPALLDDVLGSSGLLHWLAERGQPWQPRMAWLVFAVVHAAAFALRRPKAARRWALALGAVACVAGMAWMAHARPIVTSRKPLVVLIGVDAFRPDRLSAFGGTGRVAPNIESFLNDATLFTAAYTPIAQTQPAWRSLLTASWPQHTRVRYPLSPPERELALPTFPALFGAAGYQTHFATDCSRFNYLGPSSGFDRRSEPPRGAINFVLEKLRFRLLGIVAENALGARWLPEMVGNRALAGLYSPRGFADRLGAQWLEEARRGPALLAFHATAAHFPGDPVYPHYRKFVARSQIVNRGLRMSFQPLSRESPPWGEREPSEALYDELLAEADEQVGLLLSALKKAGLYDEALIVVFSDHGESFYADAPRFWGATPVHGARLSEEENHILLGIKLPRSQATSAPPRRVDSLVRLIDIGPTLLEAAGQPKLSGADGVSLMPLLKGGSMPPLLLYAETGFTHASPDVFDPAHLKGPPRTFEAYHIRTDGAVELDPRFHRMAIQEKDRGAFDGRRWIVLSPRQDGSLQERCVGKCPAPELAAWLRWTVESPPSL